MTIGITFIIALCFIIATLIAYFTYYWQPIPKPLENSKTFKPYEVWELFELFELELKEQGYVETDPDSIELFEEWCDVRNYLYELVDRQDGHLRFKVTEHKQLPQDYRELLQKILEEGKEKYKDITLDKLIKEYQDTKAGILTFSVEKIIPFVLYFELDKYYQKMLQHQHTQ